MKKRPDGYWVAVFVNIFLATARCRAAESESVKVHSPSFDISVIPLYVAKDKGYFRDEGLDSSFILAADNIGIQALIAGEFDFSASATGASRASARNILLKVVLINWSEKKVLYARRSRILRS